MSDDYPAVVYKFDLAEIIADHEDVDAEQVLTGEEMMDVDGSTVRVKAILREDGPWPDFRPDMEDMQAALDTLRRDVEDRDDE